MGAHVYRGMVRKWNNGCTSECKLLIDHYCMYITNIHVPIKGQGEAGDELSWHNKHRNVCAYAMLHALLTCYGLQCSWTNHIQYRDSVT